MSQSSTVIVYLAIYAAWVAWAVNVARKRGRDAVGWGFAAAVFGVFAVLLLYILPSKQQA